ncbi:MAG: hypothetical protein EZS28_006849 [Streblomastix strix]|uniref:Uncharacterized protein n=1 Tax=Streblomastix strix TaxID=222440 RepID=A0A5J4WSW1_9EUKA|nr:MAG: hypothetical protein EZS28_006849 [Streblomastix strix]
MPLAQVVYPYKWRYTFVLLILLIVSGPISLSLQSAFHLSLTVLVCYRSLAYIQPWMETYHPIKAVVPNSPTRRVRDGSGALSTSRIQQTGIRPMQKGKTLHLVLTVPRKGTTPYFTKVRINTLGQVPFPSQGVVILDFQMVNDYCEKNTFPVHNDVKFRLGLLCGYYGSPIREYKFKRNHKRSHHIKCIDKIKLPLYPSGMMKILNQNSQHLDPNRQLNKVIPSIYPTSIPIKSIVQLYGQQQPAIANIFSSHSRSSPNAFHHPT